MKLIEALHVLVTVRVVVSASSRLSCLPYNYHQRALPNQIHSLQVSAVLPQADVAAAAAAKASCTILPDTGASRLLPPGAHATSSWVSDSIPPDAAPAVVLLTSRPPVRASHLQILLALTSPLTRSCPQPCHTSSNNHSIHAFPAFMLHNTLADTAGADLTVDEILPDLVVPAGSAQACW